MGELGHAIQLDDHNAMESWKGHPYIHRLGKARTWIVRRRLWSGSAMPIHKPVGGPGYVGITDKCGKALKVFICDHL